MVLSNFTTTYQRDYSGDRSKAFRVQSARAPSGSAYTSGNVLQSDRPITRAGPEVNEDSGHNLFQIFCVCIIALRHTRLLH
jgi:hypothetical protein